MRHYPLLVSLLVVLLALISFLFLSSEQQIVVLPVVVALIITASCLIELHRRNGGMPLGDVGAFYIAIVCLYTIAPLFGYLARGLTFTKYSDLRLFLYQPTPVEVGWIAWRHIAYLLPCVIVYVRMRKKGQVVRGVVGEVDARLFPIVTVLLVGVEFFLIAFSIVYGVGGDNYQERLRNTAQAQITQQVPQLLSQMQAHIQEIAGTLKIIVLVLLFKKYTKYQVLIWCWLGVEALNVISGLGARYPLVQLFVAVLVLYDRFVRKVRFIPALMIGVAFLAGYTLFGFVRNYANVAAGDSTWINSSNEFESVFANAFDLYKRVDAGSLPPVPPQVYFAEFLSPIPSQLLPFPKLDGSQWYVDLLGQSGTGVGYAFGVVSESAIGLGWVELVLKGALMGYIFGRIQRWYMNRSSSFWATALNVYLLVVCYFCFRTGTFYFIPLLTWHFLPVYVIVRAFTRFGLRKRPKMRFIAVASA